MNNMLGFGLSFSQNAYTPMMKSMALVFEVKSLSQPNLCSRQYFKGVNKIKKGCMSSNS